MKAVPDNNRIKHFKYLQMQAWNRYDYMDIGGRAMQELLPRVESGAETENNAGAIVEETKSSNYRATSICGKIFFLIFVTIEEHITRNPLAHTA